MCFWLMEMKEMIHWLKLLKIPTDAVREYRQKKT